MQTQTDIKIIADAITGTVKNKQYPIVLFPADKAFVQDIKNEFHLANDMEAVRLLLVVATDYRFSPSGEDRFQAAAMVLENGRATRKRESKLEKLERQIAELKNVARD